MKELGDLACGKITIDIYKRYIIGILMLTFFILSIVALLNYKMDPAGIFKKDDFYKSFAEQSLRGNILTYSANYNEARFLKYIASMVSDKEIIVLGSSRIMGVGQSAFHNSFYNLSISSARLGDIAALWECYSQYHKTPKYIIIGLDAWMISKKMKGCTWNSDLKEYYVHAMERNNKRSDEKISLYSRLIQLVKAMNNVSYMQLLTWEYTKASIEKMLIKENTQNDIFEVVDNITHIPNNAEVIFPDGSHEWSPKMNSQTSDALAEQYIINQSDIIRFSSLDESLMLDLSTFVKELQRQGIVVIFYLTPFHPIVYEFITVHEEYDGVASSEIWFRDFAKKHSIEVYGSYNPINMDLSSEDFIDYGHLKRMSLEKYFMQNLKT